MANFLAKGLPKVQTDWSKWKVFFCDERHVDFDSADSTYRVYKEGVMTKVPLSDDNVIKINHTVPGEPIFVVELK